VTIQHRETLSDDSFITNGSEPVTSRTSEPSLKRIKTSP